MDSFAHLGRHCVLHSHTIRFESDPLPYVVDKTNSVPLLPPPLRKRPPRRSSLSTPWDDRRDVCKTNITVQPVAEVCRSPSGPPVPWRGVVAASPQEAVTSLGPPCAFLGSPARRGACQRLRPAWLARSGRRDRVVFDRCINRQLQLPPTSDVRDLDSADRRCKF